MSSKDVFRQGRLPKPDAIQPQHNGDYFDDVLPFVSREGHVVGFGSRKDAYRQREGIILAVRVLVFNSNGDILLQKRAPNKKEWPGLYSGSVSGHVNYLVGEGRVESPLEAAAREVKEELNIRNAHHLPYIPGFTEDEPMDNGLIKRITTLATFHNGFDANGVFPHNADEIGGLEWVPLRQLKDRIEQSPHEFTPGLKNFMQTRIFPKYFGENIHDSQQEKAV